MIDLTPLNTVIFENTLRKWLIALGLFISAQTALVAIRGLLSRTLKKLSEKTATDWDDFLANLVCNTRVFFLASLAFYVGAMGIVWPANLQVLIDKIPFIALIFQLGFWGNDTLHFALGKYMQSRNSNLVQTVIGPLEVIAKSLFFGLLFLLILDNFGVDITALITGLGIGGVAVALAAQSILGDLFAAIAIIIDQPFVVGDFIVSDKYMGTIEHIGMKTTRIRSLTGELLIFSNSDLLQSRIQNYRNMYERRILFTVGVTYDTPQEKLSQIAEWLKNIIDSQENVRFDRSHFSSFGDSSLVYEVVYYVLSKEYNDYVKVHHKINLAITEKFRSEGVEFAFPTRTLYLINQEPAGSAT